MAEMQGRLFHLSCALQALTAEFATLYREASAVWDEIYNFGLACRDATDAGRLSFLSDLSCYVMLLPFTLQLF